MSVVVRFRENGPIVIEGEVQLKDSNKVAFSVKTEKPNKPMALCRCGASKKKPFCDGNHKEISFIDKCEAKTFKDMQS